MMGACRRSETDVGIAQSNDIAVFRRDLHAHPELSEKETRTAQAIVQRLAKSDPSQVIDGLGSMQTGICAVYDSGAPGPTVLVRCELDALPIQETNAFEHRSTSPGVSHKCGHDGHMATLVALSDDLGADPIARGRVFLLFQPAEETGTGASAVIGDARFQALGAPDYVYAFHNVPKFPLGDVLVRKGLFAQASVGFIVRFTGKTSHSSYPEHGINPSHAVTELVTAVNQFHSTFTGKAVAPVLGTISYAQVGQIEKGPNFGTTPGEATVMGVVRAQTNEDLARLREELGRLADRLAADSGLQNRLSWHEAFAATGSDDECAEVVAQAARQVGLSVQELEEPFRWSEDFGYFTDTFTGAFFGLGSGVDQPQLHDDSYDYPDELIGTGATLYRAIIDQHLGGG